MRNGKKAVRDSVLTVIWLITAAMVLILTVVYLERLQKLYAQVDQEDPQQTVNVSEASNKAGGNGLSGSGPAGDGAAGDKGGSEAGAAAKNTDGEAGPGNGTTDTGSDPAAGEADGSATAEYAADDMNGSAGTDNDQNSTTEAENNAGEQTGTAEGGNTEAGTENASNGNENDLTGSSDTQQTSDSNPGDEDISDEARKAREKYDYSLGLDPEKPIIALSFDDGPSIYTERVISALQANHAEATFFMVGYNVREYKDVVRLVYDSGMEIGNHTIDHKKLTELSKSDVKSEVFDNEDLINAIVPVGRVVVRPPYGSHNSTVRSVVSRPMFNWTVDSLDWKTRNADSIVAQIQQDVRDGYIILMHDIYETTAEAAERIIPWLIDQGYQVTSISKMFRARGEKTDDGEVYRNVAPAQ